ncbi:MAG: PstS family phosphate ABC transporter substrate-binding protein, partial [Bacteroidota bacterium]|nr:PstS family phosphate ABC transporter substrate-binding protein [Bacteroidota bacterium]
DFMLINKDMSVSVVGGGSGVGIAALLDGTTDIAMSSRELKLDEKIKFKEHKREPIEVISALDALAIVVNNNNKIDKLTRQQLEDIFTGKVKNWKELGGEDMEISVISRESSSGTYEFFKDHVMKKKNFANDVLALTSTGAIVQSVESNKASIAYIGIAYIKGGAKLKTLKVSYDNVNYVDATIENALNKTYPIARPLYYYYDKSKQTKVKPFIDYILSDQGQKVVGRVGYVPLRIVN